MASLILEKTALVPLPHNPPRPAGSWPLPSRTVSNITNTRRNADEGLTAITTGGRKLSRSRNLSLESFSRVSSLHSSMLRRSVDDSKFDSFNKLVDFGESVTEGHADLQPSKAARLNRHYCRGGSKLLATRDEYSSGDSNFEGSVAEPGTLIDLDELENFDDLWNDEEELQILRVEERRKSLAGRTSSKIAFPKRNLPITAPFIRLPEWKHKNLLIRPSKTVELLDGDFLLITDIIRHSKWGDITLRGQRLQRCRSMNGLLERKLNEVCFFHEVDLDDPRPPVEQSAVEVSVEEVKGLRLTRKTNQIFPLCRNLALEIFNTQMEAAAEGGLTGRWKYTCTYASVVDRWYNNPKERALELLREDDCSEEFRVSDKASRFDWRGESIPGGAYRPDLEGEQLTERLQKGGIISLASSSLEPESDCTIIDSPTASLEAVRSGKQKAYSTSFAIRTLSQKRRASSSDDLLLQDDSRKNSKKVRFENRDEVETTREGLSELSVKVHRSVLRDEFLVDLTVASSSSQSRRVFSVGTNNASSLPSQPLPAPTLPHIIDLSSSDLTTPAPTGSIRSTSISEQIPVIRTPGQTLTYGDAFCGAGGTTRGAAMAGLRVMWGFDHWNHACSTWRTNFPQAICYELSSQQFVAEVQGSRYRKPVDVKVDILHLSPPCQYFSPAHTVDCPNDEMNVASLYAVGPVIKASKPRVVTLEQTFGIVAARFRKYFNSLIQMFTALSFSVRWAIVPLAQWARFSQSRKHDNEG